MNIITRLKKNINMKTIKALLLEKASVYCVFERNESHTEIIKNILKQIYEIEKRGSNQN
jgi:hypothetical protein